MTLILGLLLVAILVAAIVAIEIRDLLASAIATGAVGFGVAMLFILTQAPDLAIVQIVVEVMTVVFFVAVVLQTTHVDTTPAWSRATVLPAVAAALFAVFFLAVGVRALAALPPFGSPVMRVAQYYISEGLARTGAANVVAAIILDFRGYDTLGEAVVLYTAVLGVLAVLRPQGRR